MGSQQPDEERLLRRVEAAALSAAATAAARESRSPVVVGIDGRSGSGKTSLAREVAASWGAPLVSARKSVV